MTDTNDRALSMVRLGCPIILLDAEKEYEGDLFCPASLATIEVLQFMIRRGSGLLCMTQPRQRLEEIGIPRISQALEILAHDYAPRGVQPEGPPLLAGEYAPWIPFLYSMRDRLAGTPFHFPVDLVSHDSGISVVERLGTIQALLQSEATIDWFTTPGHLFTLGAHADGMAGRWGHTEASVDLCRALDLPPAGLLCEIVGDDGTMLRGEDLDQFAAETNVEILSISRIPELLKRQKVAAPG